LQVLEIQQKLLKHNFESLRNVLLDLLGKKVKVNKRSTVKKKKGRGTRPKRSDIKVIKIQIRGYGYYESHHEED